MCNKNKQSQYIIFRAKALRVCVCINPSLKAGDTPIPLNMGFSPRLFLTNINSE